MNIFLRPITLDDAKYIVKWRNDEKVKSHCMSKSSITIESNEAFFHTYVETGKYKQFMVDFINRDFPMVSYPIASVYLKDIDYENKRCELCIFTSPDVDWDEKSQSEGIKLLLEKAFIEYGMHKVYSYVFAKNTDELDLLISSGFEKEAVLKNESIDLNGEYEDIVRLSIFQ